MPTIQAGFILCQTLILVLSQCILGVDTSLVSQVKQKMPIYINRNKASQDLLDRSDDVLMDAVDFESSLKTKKVISSKDFSINIKSSAIIVNRESVVLDYGTMTYKVNETYVGEFKKVGVGEHVPGVGMHTLELCKGVRMKGFPQWKGRTGSGFLVGPQQMVVSNLHVSTQKDCDNIAIRFNYKRSEPASSMDDLNNPLETVIAFNDIAYCHSIVPIERSLSEIINFEVGYNVINLQWEVEDGRGYMKLASTPSFVSATASRSSSSSDGAVLEGDDKCACGLSTGSHIINIGYPHGVPMQVDGFGKVMSVDSKKGFFTTNLNIFPGSSGSAIVNIKDNRVVGIIATCHRAYYSLKVSKDVEACAAVEHYDSETGSNLGDLPQQTFFEKAICVNQFSQHVLSPMISLPSFTKGKTADFRVRAVKILLGLHTATRSEVDGVFDERMDSAIRSLASRSNFFAIYNMQSADDEKILSSSMLSVLVGVKPVVMELQADGETSYLLEGKKKPHNYGSITSNHAHEAATLRRSISPTTDGLASNDNKLSAINLLLSEHLKTSRSARIDLETLKSMGNDIKTFQEKAGITVDGIVGPQTWRYLFSSKVE